MKLSRQWSTCLRIPTPATSDSLQVLDPAWCQARGINPGAEVVLRLLRDEVLPFIQHLQCKSGLAGYHFLVHDRQSGVPAPEGDNAAFIHLRLYFRRPVSLLALGPFEMTRPVVYTKASAPSGIDIDLVANRDASKIEALLNAQSAWVLALVEAHQWTDDGAMVRQAQQMLHFFSNQLQMSAR